MWTELTCCLRYPIDRNNDNTHPKKKGTRYSRKGPEIEKAGTTRKRKEEASTSTQLPPTKKIVILRIETIQKRSISYQFNKQFLWKVNCKERRKACCHLKLFTVDFLYRNSWHDISFLISDGRITTSSLTTVPVL